MATESVPGASFRALNFEQVAHIERCIYQAAGIAGVIRVAASDPDALGDEEIAGACHAIKDLLDSISDAIHSKAEEGNS